MQTDVRRRLRGAALWGLLFLFCAVALSAALWYARVFGDVGCDAILFTLTASMEGVNGGLITAYLRDSLLPALLLSAVVYALLRFAPRPSPRWKRILCALLSLVMLFSSFWVIDLPQYLLGLVQTSPLYAQEYVDPAQTAIVFPERRRNLIYIYLESMETTFFSTAQGGAEDTCRLPELYALAAENVNFSQNDAVGGALALRGATWTMGAMIAQTSGLPMRLRPSRPNRSRLPGAVALGDILHDNGYTQALMVGSDASYGGRAPYYVQHGVDRIYDLYSARADGIVPENYRVWWGMEDERLFAYARQVLPALAEDSQPFALTLLTVDTHHIGGYLCPLCGDDYRESYDNVLACASRQVADFVAWLQTQSFYEDTVVIITGDHPTMDNGYIRRNIDPSYERRVYNCFLNAVPEDTHSKNREFSTFDMFPTTLAALGCRIEGERLGLGVNLFSGEPTLVERLGARELNALLLKSSADYERFWDE